VGQQHVVAMLSKLHSAFLRVTLSAVGRWYDHAMMAALASHCERSTCYNNRSRQEPTMGTKGRVCNVQQTAQLNAARVATSLAHTGWTANQP
jgi:hypothetical protein